MPLVFGMASSHAPSLFAQTYEGWQRVWQRFSGGVPQPPEVEREGPAVVADFVARTASAFERLRGELAAARPDTVVVFAGDQNEWFDAANLPNLMIYAGTDDIVGFHNFGADDHEPKLNPWEHPDQFGVRLTVDSELAEVLLRQLVCDGFDIAVSRSVPKHPEPHRAVPHALVRPLPLLLPSLTVPIVPIMMKTVERSQASLSGERCLDLGRAVEAICRKSDKRIALFGSGGMSHDPLGSRSGWVDEELDRWFIEQLTNGSPDSLAALFSFRSAATESGTGELRTWLPVAAAMDAQRSGNRATLVDYFAARKSTCGNGWVYWPNI